MKGFEMKTNSLRERQRKSGEEKDLCGSYDIMRMH